MMNSSNQNNFLIPFLQVEDCKKQILYSPWIQSSPICDWNQLGSYFSGSTLFRCDQVLREANCWFHT